MKAASRRGKEFCLFLFVADIRQSEAFMHLCNFYVATTNPEFLSSHIRLQKNRLTIRKLPRCCTIRMLTRLRLHGVRLLSELHSPKIAAMITQCR